MRSVRFTSTPLGVLIAIVAIGTTAPAAKADLAGDTISFSDGTGASYSLTFGSAFHQTSFSGTATLPGSDFSVSYTVSDTYNAASKTELLSVTATVVDSIGAGGGTDTLSYSLVSGNTKYSLPSSGPASLTTTLAASNWMTSGSSTSNSASLSGASSTYTPKTGSVVSNTTSGIGLGHNSTETSSSSISSLTQYGLGVSGSETVTVAGNTGTFTTSSTFTASAKVHAVPEPSGVIAALAGLPFMVLVLGFARRLRGASETAVAV